MRYKLLKLSSASEDLWPEQRHSKSRWFISILNLAVCLLTPALFLLLGVLKVSIVFLQTNKNYLSVPCSSTKI